MSLIALEINCTWQLFKSKTTDIDLTLKMTMTFFVFVQGLIVCDQADGNFLLVKAGTNEFQVVQSCT